MQHIPNSITLINVLAGSCASICLFAGEYDWAIAFLALAAFADFVDGLVARLLSVSSSLGKELDSLADMISFGFIPGLIAYLLLDQITPGGTGPINWYALPGFLITVFAALRLARFNLDERQTQDFIGLPTPSCTLFFTGLLAITIRDQFGLTSFFMHEWVLYSFIALFSWLMNAEIPMFSFKFKGGNWKGNEIRYIFGGIAIALLIFLQEAAFSLIIIIYLLIAGTQTLAKKSS